MKKILVSTDFTKYGNYAVKAAASIAEQVGSQLSILYILDRPISEQDGSYQNYSDVPEEINFSEPRKKLREILQPFKLTEVKTLEELRYNVPALF